LGTASLANTKSSPTDVVTEADRASERLILEGLRRSRPQDGVLGEEGTQVLGTSGIRWVVDPLDGTVNYLYDHPSGWSVSIAAEDDAGTLIGVVFDPPRRETFTASRGEGAWCNGERVSVSGCMSMASALVGTGFSYVAKKRAEQARQLIEVLPRVRDIRRAGSAALDMAWVSAGRLDAFYEAWLAPWDWAASSLTVTEAGGLFTRNEDGLVIAASPALFEPLRHLLVG
jgi:fructose-1,6-bisphosphatase/inositol monophosphatase family enzyme